MEKFSGKTDVVIAWDRQSHPSGEERRGLKFEGPALIHYSTLIAYRLRNGGTLLNPVRYSNSTSKVQYLVRQSRRHNVYEAPLEGFETADEERIRKELGGEIVAKIRAQAVTVTDQGNVTFWCSSRDCREQLATIAAWQRRARELIRAGIIRARSVPRRVLNIEPREGETARQCLQRIATTVFRHDLQRAECDTINRKLGASWWQVGAALAVPCLSLAAKRERARLTRSFAQMADAKSPLDLVIRGELPCALDATHPARCEVLARCAALFLPPKHPARLDIERAAANPPALVTPPPFNASIVEMQLIANGTPPGVHERALAAVEQAYRQGPTVGTIPQASLTVLDDGRLAWVAAPRPHAPVYFRF